MIDSAGTRRSTLFFGVIVGFLLLPFFFAAPAWGHAGLIGTDPADGAILASAPTSISITFTEPVGLAGDGTNLLDATGHEIPSQVEVLDAVVVLTPQEALADGTYLVSWRVLSADSHPIAGGISFSVGAPSQTVTVAAAEPETDTALAVSKIVLEGLRYLGLLALVGLIGFRRFIDRDSGAVAGVAGRFRRAEIICGITAVVSATALIPVVQAWQNGTGPSSLLTAVTWSEALQSESALAAALTLFAAATLRWRPPATFVLGAVAAAGSLIAVGHTRVFGPAWLVIGADVLHVLTAAAWLGGLLGLGLILIKPADTTDPAVTATVLARFSSVAGWLVLGLGVAAVLLNWRITDQVLPSLTTPYGVLVLVKLGLVLVVLAIAAVNRFSLVPAVRADPATGLRRVRRTVAAEAVLLVVVTLVTGALVAQSPRDDAAINASKSTALTLDDATATVVVSPSLRGLNTIEFTLVQGGLPVITAADPTVSVSLPDKDLGPFSRPVVGLGDGRWQTEANFLVPGTWTVRIGVRLSEFSAPTATIQVIIPD